MEPGQRRKQENKTCKPGLTLSKPFKCHLVNHYNHAATCANTEQHKSEVSVVNHKIHQASQQDIEEVTRRVGLMHARVEASDS